MITLQKLSWGNWFSYGDNNEIDFTQDVVTQILGVNGNGKSSIPLIIEEMIYNKNSKGIKKADIPNRYLNKGYWGKLWFTKDGDEYQIDLDRKTNIKVKLFKNGEDISSHTATNTFKTIEEIIGIDFKTFSQLVYQNTTSSLQFLTATDTNRKKFLIELLQLEEYVKYFEFFKEEAKVTGSKVSSLEGQVETVEKWLKSNALEDCTLRDLIPVEEYDVSSEEQEIGRLSVEITNIDKTNNQINKNEQYKKMLAAINIEEVNGIDAAPTISYDSEQHELGGLEAEAKRKSAYVGRIHKLGDNCPTCEQTITSEFKSGLVKGEEEELEQIKTRIIEISETISTIKANNALYKQKQDRIKEWEELFTSINRALPSETLDKDELVNRVSELAIRVSNVKDSLKAVTLKNQEIAKHNSKVSVIEEQSAKFEKELTEYSEKLSVISRELASLELLKKAFSTNGLVAYKIENLVKDLEELTNDYLAELSDGRFTIEFSVASDKLNVNVTDNGNVIDILALSSGELARVNTATLLALRSLMSSISKSKINILFLDEVINVLDEAGREKLVEVLLAQDLNTYIVSHGWSHPLLTKLEVVKDDNISRIEHA